MQKKPFRRVVSMTCLLMLVALVVFILAYNRSEPPLAVAFQPQQQPMQVAPDQSQMQMQPQDVLPVASYPAQAAQTPSGYQPASGYAPSTGTPGPQSFSQIQVGISSQDVIALMGQPGRVKPEHGGFEWKYYTPQGKVEIYMQNDRVVSFKAK